MLSEIIKLWQDAKKRGSMIALARSLAAPLTSLIFLILGSGLLNTFISIRLELEGYSTEVIGITSSALYIGVLLGSLWLDRWIEKVGHVKALAAFAIASTLLVLAQAIWVHPVYWSALRLFCGVCTAGIFIAIESWLLMQSPTSSRIQPGFTVLYGFTSTMIQLLQNMVVWFYTVTHNLTQYTVTGQSDILCGL